MSLTFVRLSVAQLGKEMFAQQRPIAGKSCHCPCYSYLLAVLVCLTSCLRILTLLFLDPPVLFVAQPGNTVTVLHTTSAAAGKYSNDFPEQYLMLWCGLVAGSAEGWEGGGLEGGLPCPD